MSAGSLLDATKDLGVRFRLVSLFPSAVLALIILALIWSGAPGQSPNIGRIGSHARELRGWQGVALIVGLLAATLVVEPLQLALVRLLEGYWLDSRLGRVLAAPGMALQRRRRQRLESVQQRRGEEAARSTAEREAAAQRLRRYPSEAALLPTTLGNVLRSAETRAGSRYALDAIAAWPRLHPLLSETLSATLSDLRDQLDLGARFTAVFVIGACVSLGLLATHGWWLVVPAVNLALAWVSYRSVVAAAVAYGEGIETAFDLHRFDLLRALHLPLPADLLGELAVNERLTRFMLAPSEEVFRLRETGKGLNLSARIASRAHARTSSATGSNAPACAGHPKPQKRSSSHAPPTSPAT